MYKEKRVKIPNSREIREILIKIHYLWKTNTHTDTHTHVVICFHFSIFEPLETAKKKKKRLNQPLWFAFILLSLNHWKQRYALLLLSRLVVICFHFSIFEPLETATATSGKSSITLWFAFILVSLNHWKQHKDNPYLTPERCDLLSF